MNSGVALVEAYLKAQGRRVIYDAEAVYIAAYCYDREPERKVQQEHVQVEPVLELRAGDGDRDQVHRVHDHHREQQEDRRDRHQRHCEGHADQRPLRTLLGFATQRGSQQDHEADGFDADLHHRDVRRRQQQEGDGQQETDRADADHRVEQVRSYDGHDGADHR